MPDRTPSPVGEPTRQKLLATLADLRAQGKAPTAQELAEASGVSFTNVRNHLAHLRHAGLIAYRDMPVHRTRREIILLDNTQEQPPTEQGG